MPRHRLVFCALILWPSMVCGQSVDASNPWFVRASLGAGRILPTNPFGPGGSTGGSSIDSGQNFTVEIGRQTDGSAEWHQMYGMPSYGVGVSFASFRSDLVHSRPVEAYTFFSWPFARLTDRVDLTSEFGMGLSWHWAQFNKKTASYESVLGSDLNARINWGLFLRWRSTPRTLVSAGIDYTHRSNGGLVQPDQGINMLGPKIAMQYNFGPDAQPKRAITRPPFKPSWEFVVGGATGAKSVAEETSPLQQRDFVVAAVTTGVQRQFYRYGKFAGGADFVYDDLAGARFGVYGGYEHVIGRFGALVQPGYIVAGGFDGADSPRFYARFGWRYHLNDRFWSSLTIRAVQGRKAEALEIGAGYRFRRFSTH